MWLFQLVDYVIKALVNYRLTPEGAKEWDDFVSAFESDDGGTFDPFSVQQPQASQRSQQREQRQQPSMERRASRRGGLPVVEDQPFTNTNQE